MKNDARVSTSKEKLVSQWFPIALKRNKDNTIRNFLYFGPLNIIIKATYTAFYSIAIGQDKLISRIYFMSFQYMLHFSRVQNWNGLCNILVFKYWTNRLSIYYALCCLFVSWGFREFFTHMETSPWPVKECTFWPILGTHGHWAVSVL